MPARTIMSRVGKMRDEVARKSQSSEKSSVLLLPYFGEWPVWLPAFLHSCSRNKSVDWTILSDNPRPSHLPANVSYSRTTLPTLQRRASERLNTDVALSAPYKLCDLRPAYADIFPEEVEGFDYWGHCDLDIVWGNLSNFLEPYFRDDYDVISARANSTCGHFTLYRNRPSINGLYAQHERWPKVVQDPTAYYFDEVGMTEVLRDASTRMRLSVQWDRYLFNFPSYPSDETLGPSHLFPKWNGWIWKDGRLYRSSPEPSNEVMYLHFMTWKRSLQTCRLDLKGVPDKFYISYSHIDRSRWSLPENLLKAAYDYLHLTASMKRRQL